MKSDALFLAARHTVDAEAFAAEHREDSVYLAHVEHVLRAAALPQVSHCAGRGR